MATVTITLTDDEDGDSVRVKVSSEPGFVLTDEGDSLTPAQCLALQMTDDGKQKRLTSATARRHDGGLETVAFAEAGDGETD